ncbi:MAG: GAF domain-containing sensor histidine kinase [Acidimicrobiales bacterium]
MAAENRLLRRVIEVTAGDLDIDEVSRRLASVVTEATGSDVCFVHVVDAERQVVVLAGGTPPFDQLSGTVELGMGQGVAGWVAANARPAIIGDKWTDPRYHYIPALRGEDYTSMASVPLLVRGRRVVGVLNVHSRATDAYGPDQVALLTRVAALLAPTVDNARLYRRLAEREEALERFATQIIDAQEAERRRLAGDIHDGIGQRLISLWYHLLAAEDLAAEGLAADDGVANPALEVRTAQDRTAQDRTAQDRADALSRELAMAKSLATDALSDTRSAIAGLRPPVLDDLGLAAGLESLARSLPGPVVDVAVSAVELPSHVEVALYRIAQEALANVVKHAGATSVHLALRCEHDSVELIVRDDGRGFEVAANDRPPGDRATGDRAYGMDGIRERAELIGARLSLVSRPGQGTILQVSLPLTDS